MKKKLLLLSFIEGAAVMCAELGGARLLAPLFGSSLYVWAAVMGITLGALAAGYFFGGVYSGHVLREKFLRNILLAAGIYLLAMPVLAHYALPRLSYLPFTAGMLLSTMLLLLPSVFFLGASSPLFISIQTIDPHSAGRVSGTVYAVSTAGGILSTFLCGFYLIPDMGLNFTLSVHGLLLLVGTFIILRGLRTAAVLVAVGICFIGAGIRTDRRVIFSADGIHGRIEVTQVIEQGRPIRRLLVNGIIQTEINPTNGKTTLKYVHLLDSLLPPTGKGSRALVLGAGGGSAANMLVQKGYSCRAVEFDERMIAAARDYFFIRSEVELVHDDARHFMNMDTTRYNLVLVDVFKAEEQPSHVLTVESLGKLRSMLLPGGQLIINWHGYDTGPLAEGTEVLLNTLAAAGLEVQKHFTGNDPDFRNTVMFAMSTSSNKKALRKPFNSDNRAAMEKYNARANKTWRTNYLRYYQGATSQ